jgi:hypothetical protein
MPSFEYTPVAPNNPLNAFYDSGKNSLAINALQQAQTDRATLRGLASGLATRNPGAVAGASVLPGGSEAINSLSGMDTAQAQIKAEQARLLMLQPDLSSPPVPGPQASTGNPAPTDGSAASGGDVSGGNPLLGPIPGYDLAGRPIGISNGTPAPADATQPPGTNHPAQPVVQALAAHIMSVPPEERPALYAKLSPAATAAGATVPPQYPGDDVIEHLAGGGWGHPNAQPAPAPASTAPVASAPRPVQVAGPGAPTAASPTFAPTPADLPTMQGQPLTAPAGNETPADVLTRLRSQQPQTLPDENGVPTTVGPGGAFSPVPQSPVSSLGPSSPVAGSTPPPPNTLSGPMPQPAPQTASPGGPFMPAASAQPPAGAQQPPNQPAPIGLPPPGAVMATQRMTGLPWPGAQPGNAWYQVPGVRGLQQFRDPGQPQTLTIKDSGSQRNFYDSGGNLVRTETIPGGGRETLVYPFGDGRSQMEKDGKLIGPVFPADTRKFSIDMAMNDNDKVLPALSAQALDQEQTLQKTLEARDAAAKVPTGANFDNRAAFANWLTTYQPEIAAKIGVGAKGSLLPNPSQAAEAVKLLAAQSQQSEKAMGGSGGLGINKMFADANANTNMQGTGIRDISNLNAVTAIANKDYLQGKINHIEAQTAAIQTPGGGQYKPISSYEKAWFTQDNTLTYYGAVKAANGAPYAEWSKGLSDANKQRALGVIARFDPTAKVDGDNGHPLAVSGFMPQDRSNPSGVVAK